MISQLIGCVTSAAELVSTEPLRETVGREEAGGGALGQALCLDWQLLVEAEPRH